MVYTIMKKVDIVQQTVLKLQTTRNNWIGKSISYMEVSITYDEVLSAKEKLANLYEEFTLTKISSTDAAHEQTFETVKNAIRTLQIQVADAKKKKDDAAVARTKPIPFKLEKIKLPQFSGQFSDWQDFHDLFSSAVENNSMLHDSEKMVYLKSSLTGEAATIVSSFSTASTSFSDAWDLVKKRYSNNREIVFAHLRKFDEFKPIQETSQGLRKLVDTINECVRSLSALSIPVSYWDLIFIFMALKKLDLASKKEWLLTQGVDLPKLSDFISFLEKRATALADSSLTPKVKAHTHQKSSHHAQTVKSSDGKHCILCNGSHYLNQCKAFINMAVSDRQNYVKENQLCFNCLKKGHAVLNCKVSISCKKCNRKHSTLLHMDSRSNVNDLKQNNDENVKASSAKDSNSREVTDMQEEHVILNHVNSVNSSKVVLFETGIGYAMDSSGQKQRVRIFFDPGSESHFISESCMERLNLSRHKSCVKVGGIGGSELGTSNGMANVKIFSSYNDKYVEFNALIMPKITKSMPKTTCKATFSHIQGLHLADPYYYAPGKVDILIGAPLTGKIKLPGFIVGPQGTPDAQNTIFGWVLSGESSTNVMKRESTGSYTVTTYHTKCSVHDPCINESLTKFWEIEEVNGSSNTCTSKEEDEEAQNYFKATTVRRKDGRYAVKLPFKPSFENLGESKLKAVNRLRSVEKSLEKNKEMKESYFRQFQEFIDNKLIKEVPENEMDCPNSYYMPHHVVTKLESSSTKYRIVFDASCKTTNGLSLNDVLMTGPKIKNDLMPLLIKFRTHQIAMSADIVKFYNQFEVQEPDANYQRLVFRNSPEEKVKLYKMVRICFGITSSPYLAVRCLHQLAEDYKESHPLLYEIIKDDFLIDNLLSGATTVKEALEIQSQITDVMEKAQLKLKKWASNHPDVVNSVPPEDREMIVPHYICEDSTINTIGLQWNPTTDTFSIKIQEPKFTTPATKRQVLSIIASQFDPLGWLTPVTVRFKMLLQSIWKENLDWDTELSTNLSHKWIQYVNELPYLKEFNIDRCVTESNYTNECDIQGFCDASNLAYAACVYMKSGSKVSLICAKSKVTPVKGETIPRLELCAAHLLAKLINAIMEPLKNIKINQIYCWTDSTIVLSWLNSNEKLPVFVNNRVRSINQLLPKAIWNHVDGKENPADLGSRGMSVKPFLISELWLKGPSWLSSFNGVNYCHMHNDVNNMDHNLGSYYQKQMLKLIYSCSDFMKMKRLIAYWVKYVNQIKVKVKRESNMAKEHLTIDEMNLALVHIVKVIQQEMFPDEISRLSKLDQRINNTLKSMSLFMDVYGVLRVGGRIRRSFYDYDMKHPILLPKNHCFTLFYIGDNIL